MIQNLTLNAKEQHDFRIGGFLIRIVGGGSDMRTVGGFEPFLVNENQTEEPILIFTTNSEIDESVLNGVDMLFHFDWEFDDIKSDFFRHKNGYGFTMVLPNQKPFIMWQENGNIEFKTNLTRDSINPSPTMLRHMLWTAFGIAIAKHKAITIHSSTLEYKGKTVMCLGESGTGKSTHTRLWRENIAGATLLNDDCPILKVEGDEVVTYGSPWSGKTPCYRAERFPVKAIIRIVRAPYNKMHLQNALGAFSALQPSCPPAFAYDETLSDYIYSTLSDIIKRVPVYRLECLPNAEAAQTSFNEIFGKK